MAVIDDIRRSLELHLEEVEGELVVLRTALAAIVDEGASSRRRARRVATGPAHPPRAARTRRRARHPRRTERVSGSRDDARASESDTPAVQTDAPAPATADGPGGDNGVSEFLRSWPERLEAEQWAQELAKLSPLQLAKLRQFVEQEIDSRRKGRPVGFTINARRGAPAPSSQRLISAGFVRLRDGRLELTDRGRAAGRLLVEARGDPARPWWHEVMAPVLEPRG